MRISDWSSDVCSSDLRRRNRFRGGPAEQLHLGLDATLALDRGTMPAFEIDERRDRRTGETPDQHAKRERTGNADEPAFAYRKPAPPIFGLVGPEIGRASCRERRCQTG